MIGLLQYVMSAMDEVEKKDNKKQRAINIIEKKMSPEIYAGFKDIIPDIIELIVELSKNKNAIKINKKLKWCFSKH